MEVKRAGGCRKRKKKKIIVFVSSHVNSKSNDAAKDPAKLAVISFPLNVLQRIRYLKKSIAEEIKKKKVKTRILRYDHQRV